MKQRVDITLKLSLWLDATMGEDDIVTYVRSALPNAFGEDLTAMKNPVDVLSVKEESATHGDKRTPPDPERMNDKRAAWAAAAVHAFMDETGVDEEDAVADLVSDLMHWCDRHDYDFNAALERGKWHYGAETGGETQLAEKGE